MICKIQLTKENSTNVSEQQLKILKRRFEKTGTIFSDCSKEANLLKQKITS